jgi:hypothetical protein
MQQLLAQDQTLEQLAGTFISHYIDSVSNYATVFYGKLQEPYSIAASNHPYLNDSRYVQGKLSYGGVIYPDMPLRLDLYRDELLMPTPDRQYNIVLVPEKLGRADLHGYHLTYLKRDNLPGCPPSGYYMLLHDGQCAVFEKQTTVLQQKISQQGIESSYSLTVRYYIRKDGAYYQIKNKKSLLNALGACQKELERLIRANKFRFKRDAERMIAAVVKEYEKLNDQ